jgi:Phosphotransferase system IIA components
MILEMNKILSTISNMNSVKLMINSIDKETNALVGMDTVKLNGKYFTPKAKQGDTIKAGQVILEFDINAIKNEGYSLITPVIITNSNNHLDIIETDKNDIEFKEDLLTIMIYQ